MERLTDQAYWEQYYKQSKTNRNQIESICSQYDAYWNQLIENNSNKGKKTLIEIGGHPGRYLSYLARKYNLNPTSLDFNSDRSKIDECMAAFEIKDYHIVQADLFKHTPTELYDIVISNGFIEHFDNFDEVLDKHMLYLKPGGTMLIMIPNMRGYIKFYKHIADNANFNVHNLKCMSLKVFSDFAERSKLKIISNVYFGTFPFSVHHQLNFFQNIFFQTHRLIFKKIFDKMILKNPNKMFSSTIIAVFKN
jgi:cyclopropane fatty-acyl-phospholipid synthase-like methyltransferase